jgi:hypothetical protein
MDKSNTADKVVKVIRVYESGRVRASRAPREWATAHAVPAEVTDKPKDPKKVAAGKARAAKAAAAKLAGTPFAGLVKAKTKRKAAAPAKKKPAAPKSKAKKAAKPKAAAPKKPAAPRPDGRSKNAMVVCAFRVTRAQKKKLHRLGNGKFMRDRIDRAPEPK